MQRSITTLLVACLAFLAAPTPAARASTLQGDKTSSATAHYVWTGVAIAADGSRRSVMPIETVDDARARANPRAMADTFLRELAAIQVGIEVERDLAAAATKLDDLLVRAAWKGPYEARSEVLRALALARSAVFEKRGRHDAAIRALEQVLPDESVKQALAEKYEFELASAAELEAERALLASDAMRLARARLSPAADGATTTPQGADAGIFEVVRDVFAGKKNGQLLDDLGARAVPALEKLVLADLSQYPDGNGNDPLYQLAWIDPERAGRLMLDNFGFGGFLWQRRMVRALSAVRFADDRSWRWSGSPDQGPRFVYPAAEELLAKLIAQPGVASGAMGFLSEHARRDALTPDMQRGLEAALDSDDVSGAQNSRAALGKSYGRKTVDRVMQRALASRNVESRRFAAEFLTHSADTSVLLPFVSDPDAGVRDAVAVSLGRHDATVVTQRPDGRIEAANSNVTPVLDDAGRQALTRLLDDADANVRRTALGVALRLDPPLSAESFTRFLTDPDPKVRESLLDVPWDHPVLPIALEALAKEADPAIVNRVDVKLQQLAGRDDEVDPLVFERFVPAVLARIANSAKAPVSSGTPLQQPLWNAMRTPGDVRSVTEQCLAAEADWPIESWVAAVLSRTNKFDPRAEVSHLPPQRIERALRRLFALPAFATRLENGFVGAFSSIPWPLAALLPIANDPSAPVGLRCVALRMAAPFADEAVDSAVIRLATDPVWSKAQVDATDIRRLEKLMGSYSTERKGPLIDRLVADSAVSDQALVSLLAYTNLEGVRPATATALYDRWSQERDAKGRVVVNALFVMDVHDPRVVEILQTAARGRSTTGAAAERSVDVMMSAVTIMGRSKEAVFLPVLGECLRAEWVADREDRFKVQQTAVDAVTNYMSEAAAREILAAISAPGSERIREQCLAALQQIRTYLDEKKRWETRDSDLEKRAAAVKQLVGLLADADPATRAQAAKSLATMNAIEELPRLIGLLKDKSVDVRSAAQLAIDQLNAKNVKRD